MAQTSVLHSASLIKSIKVEGLFGLYSYALPEDGLLQNGAILYGDNGAGKSTILRLVFHMLSAADDRGHRGALYKADFKKLEVELSSGVTVCAVQNKSDQPKVLSLSIAEDNRTIAEWDFLPRSERQGAWIDESTLEFIHNEGIIRAANGELIVSNAKRKSQKSISNALHGERPFLSALKSHAPTMFILNAERRLDSDTVADPSDEMELRRVMRYEEPKRINDLVVRSREIALSQALNTAAQWIRKKAIKGANQGSVNVHTVYGNVLQHLVAPKSTQIAKTSDISELSRRLANVEAKTAELAKYEFETPLSTSAFKKSLGARSKAKAELAAGLLEPYIRSVESRLEAVTPIYEIVDRFVRIINTLLHDKKLAFTLSQGFTIENKLNAKLEPNQLSSGEQQLLLLFCYVLTARDNPSVFMIDEPEISLNIKWQRQLIQSLLDITINSKIQFVFASHSMELFSQHRKRVVRVGTK